MLLRIVFIIYFRAVCDFRAWATIKGESFLFISKLVVQALGLLTGGLTMPSTKRIKFHINKTPLTNNGAAKLRSVPHKTLFKFSGGRETSTIVTYRKANILEGKNIFGPCKPYP